MFVHHFLGKNVACGGRYTLLRTRFGKRYIGQGGGEDKSRDGLWVCMMYHVHAHWMTSSLDPTLHWNLCVILQNYKSLRHS